MVTKELSPELRAYLEQLTIPYTVGTCDHKLHIIRKVPLPVPRELLPDAIKRLHDDYMAGKWRRDTDNLKWREARKRLSRYGLIDLKDKSTREFDRARSRVNHEQRRHRAKLYAREWRRRVGNGGYGRTRVPRSNR